MIGTAITAYINFGGGGGGSGALYSKTITMQADNNKIQDADLIGALRVETIVSSSSGIVNKGYVFTPGTGTINNYPVMAGEVHTIIFKSSNQSLGTGLNCKTITVQVDSEALNDAALVGVAEVAFILSSSAGIVNKGFEFDANTGNINNYAVMAGEVHTVFYKTA